MPPRTATNPSQKRTAPVHDHAAQDNPPLAKRRRTLQPVDSEKKDGDGHDGYHAVPTNHSFEEESVESDLVSTPTKACRGRPPKQLAVPTGTHHMSTPGTSCRKDAALTPSKLKGMLGIDTPGRRHMADRSAKRKSTRLLITKELGGTEYEDEDEGVDDEIARQIYDSSEAGEVEDGGQEASDKNRAKAADRQNARQKRSPTPPSDLPPHEQYLYQNKPGVAKTSANTLSSLHLLTHDEYFAILRTTEDGHAGRIQHLESLHAQSFPQWVFELSQGFSICLYGYGSKRRLLHRFATHLFHNSPHRHAHKMVMVNGHVRTTTLREILATIGSALDPSHRLPAGNAMAAGHAILDLLAASHETTLTLVVHSVDAAPLRRPGTQAVLARLAAHARLRLVCSADTPDFALLWDGGLRAAFAFAFHDATTFAPLADDIDVVDEVHDLLGRKTTRTGGKQAVAFVLRSLPENARSLFRLLVGEVLAAIEHDSASAADGTAIEYRILYNKAVEEFICSSEMAFRTLLKE